MKTLTYRNIMTWFALFLGVHLIAQTDSVRTKQIPPYHAHRIILKYRTDPPHSVIKKNGRCLVQIREIDSLNVLYGCCHTRRMFPSALKNSEGLHMDRIFIFRFEKIENMDRLIKDYRDTGHFEYVEPDYTGKGGGRAELIPNDTYFNRQWSMKNDGTFPTSHPGTPDADIDMDEGWNITQGSNQIVGAILDTGCKMDHPEFSGRIWSNLNETASNGIDDDGNGYIDDIQGWDFAYDDNNPVDDHGHGTNVAGIVGATGNNDMGYAGVDWNCKLMIGKILNSENWGYYTWWMSAIEYVVNQGAHVINMSVGGASFSSGLQDAVNYAYQNNVVLCACMMNVNNSDPYYPAAYQNTIAVGATDTDD